MQGIVAITGRNTAFLGGGLYALAALKNIGSGCSLPCLVSEILLWKNQSLSYCKISKERIPLAFGKQ